MKRRKTNLLSLLLALVVLLSLTACGGGAGDNVSMAAETASAAEDTAYGYYDSDEPMEMEAAAEEGADSSYSYNSDQVKMIYTATLDVEVLDLDKAVESLQQLVEESGGYIQSSNVGGYGSNYRYASYTVRVPSEQYQAFVNAWSESENCHLLSKQEDVEDVGAQYFDAETRLNTLKTKMERLQALLAEATEMEDIITIESAISDTEYEIERYTSELNRYDSLINFSTVDIYFSQVVTLTEEEETSFLARLGQNFQWGIEHFVEGMADLALWAAYHTVGIMIFVVVAAVVLLLLRKRFRNRKGKMPYHQTGKASDAEAETRSDTSGVS